MGIKNGLLICKVSHARQRPKRNAFTYGVFYLCFALDELQQLKNFLFSLNRWNIFSFYEKDHGEPEQKMDVWVKGVLSQFGVTKADGRIVLMTLPRVLGYVFNPVSFWFCLDKEKNIRAVISEVQNTFGDKHSYISFHDDQRPITKDDHMKSEKIFHVSPFIAISGHYLFRFYLSDAKVGVWIDHYDEEGLLITTSVTGKRTELSPAHLTYAFFRYPLVTFKVIGLIHYQALKLAFKGIRYRTRPNPPTTEVSR